MKTNFEEYNNPALYDIENDGHIADVLFLEKWASKVKGSIIDLACGTGRVTIPLAQKGYQMIGVDIHSGMLNHAKMKSQSLNISFVEQDCTALDLNVKSSLICMTGNSFQHFHTNEEQDRLLKSVHNHLDDNGIFIFDTRFPGSEELLQPETEEYWRRFIDEEGRAIDVSTISRYDAVEQLQHYTTIRRMKNPVQETKTNITLRYVYPKEMERLLETGGFELVEMYQDWNETPLTANGYSMIIVCRKKRGRTGVNLVTI